MKTKTLLFVVLAVIATNAPASWSTFHGNNQRNGRTTAVVPASPVVKWSFDCGGSIITSPVIAPNGDIFVGPVWEDKLKPRQFFYAIRPDGTLKWRFETPWIDDQAIGTPAIGPDGRIYFGTASGKFYCLDANGNVVWTYQGLKSIQTQVLVTADGVYAGIDGSLMAFAFDGTVRWQLPMMPMGGATETLQGNIVFHTSTGVTCASPSGAVLWTGGGFGSLSVPVIAPNGDVISCGGMIFWFDPLTGATKHWLNPLMDGSYGSPAVDAQGNVYHVTGYETFKFSSTGTILFSGYLQDPNSNFLGHSWSSPAIDGSNRLYFGMGNGKRSAIQYEKNLNVRTLGMSQVMLFPLPHIAGTSAPAIADNGTLYVGCIDGKLYAIGQ